MNDLIKFIRRQPRWRQIAAAAIIALAGWWLLRSGGASAAKAPTFPARRGPLEINVLEGGSLQALESQEVKCEVRVGYQGTKILRIVEEGYLVTEDDVKNGKVLVELDSSDLEKQIAQQEIQYQQAVASLIDAQQNYEIQLNQNQSDIKAAEQKARFARMDFDKFLGNTVTEQIIKDYGLDKILTDASTNNVEQTSHAQMASLAILEAPPSVTEPLTARPIIENTRLDPVISDNTNAPPAASTNSMALASGPAGSNDIIAFPISASPLPAAPIPDSDTNLDIAAVPESAAFPSGLINFSRYANIDVLGDGEAKQKLRKFEDDLQVAQKELGQAKATLEGTKRLYEKQFVAKNELEKDQLAQDSAELKVQTAETDRALFLKYDFSKTAEQSLSDYTEAVRELDKARRVAISKLAQAQAKLKSAQGQYEVQTRQRKDLNDQLGKCTIRAQKSGLVVYGGSGDYYYGNQEPIREGATVRERQSIITIPDMTRMSVNVKIHESYIKKIKKGQKVRITVDAFPDTALEGEITKVGVLPDSQNRYLNPDLKVYNTTITINGTYDWVKPGMSARVEILVNKLDDVVYVPVQAVSPNDGKQFCYVAGAFKPERREVEIGDFNDEFIEIKHGLKEGERVLLRLPDGVETGGPENANPPGEQKPNGTDKPVAPAIPASAAPPKGA
ncbi:MAG: efflux RND transporter periplasmic adaptor subunit [Verrucomicrobiota bacterium]